ncbi:hypothetical protein ACMFMG_004771 [Clarireedia jacksonii]
MSRVKGLVFDRLPSTGPGVSKNIQLAALPQMENGELKDLHLAVSNKNWIDWYAYIPDFSKGRKMDGEEIMAWTAHEPMVTLMEQDTSCRFSHYHVPPPTPAYSPQYLSLATYPHATSSANILHPDVPSEKTIRDLDDARLCSETCLANHAL